MVMLCISTVWAYAKLPDGPSQGKAPLFVRYTVALWYLDSAIVIEPRTQQLKMILNADEAMINEGLFFHVLSRFV